MSTKPGSHLLVDPSDEPRSERVARRLRTVPTVVALFLVVTLLAPVILGLTGIADLMRRRHDWTLTRLAVFGWVFLASETVGLIALGAAWLAGGRRTVELTWAFQRWWSSTLFKTLRSVFRLRFVVEGDDQVAPGPVIVMMRHASIVDNLLPAGLVSLPHRIRLRYVLKKELLWDPVLDIGGQRLPNVFVRREGDSATEITRIRRLAIGLTERDGVLIYPEGTRFTAKKRDQTIRRLERTDPALADRARQFRRLLPPRPGGPMSLLDSGADVVMCAHHGLEGLARVSDVLRAGLVGRTVHVGFRRIEADQIPSDRSERVAWLFDQWQQVDDWIDTVQAEVG
jgi:1-acyl-sn-glycerol-3-phosphate acyltransferase